MKSVYEFQLNSVCSNSTVEAELFLDLQECAMVQGMQSFPSSTPKRSWAFPHTPDPPESHPHYLHDICFKQ